MEAFGAECVLINCEAPDLSAAEQVFGANICGFGKTVYEKVKKDGIKELVLVDCCDTIKSVCDILNYEGELDFLYMIDVPHDGRECERELFAKELIRFAEAFGEYKGTEFDPELFFKERPEALMPAGNYIGILGARVGEENFKLAEEVFGPKVRNLTCANNRKADIRNISRRYSRDDHCETYEPGSEAFAGLMADYSAMLLDQIPCMRMKGKNGRDELLYDPYLEAIIYNTVKFCDFYGFEYGKLLKEAKVPLLKIETDFTTESRGQLITRLEAFRETLGTKERDDMEETRMTQEYIDFLEETYGDGQERTPEFKYVAGIDSGSTSTEAIVMRSDGFIMGKGMADTGASAVEASANALKAALEEAGIEKGDLSNTVSTGYGRTTVESDGDVTEISCHAAGAILLCPGVRTVIDIGGQDSKVITIGENGRVENFTMNDKCAAGTGRFLDMTAMTLGTNRDDMAKMGVEYDEDISVSSTCSVFAQSEVVTLVAANKAVNDIVHGINKAVAGKTAALVTRVDGKPPYFMTGGVAKNAGLVKALEEVLGEHVEVNEFSEYCGAIGAALYALMKLARK